MAEPSRLDIARAVGELSPATKERVAESLGVKSGSSQFEKAFEAAAERGLVEPEPSGAGGGEQWTLTDKGRRRLSS